MSVLISKRFSVSPSDRMIEVRTPATQPANRLEGKYLPPSEKLPQFASQLLSACWKQRPHAVKAKSQIARDVMTAIARHAMSEFYKHHYHILGIAAIKDLLEAKGGGRLGFSYDPRTGLISRVEPGSGAAKAGIRVGDRFSSVNSIPIKTALSDCSLFKIKDNKLFIYSVGEKTVTWRGPKGSTIAGTHIPKAGISAKKYRMSVKNSGRTFEVTLKKLKPGEHCLHDLVFGPVGSKAVVTISRNGKRMDLTVVRGK
jgi:hypothetical protein